MELRNVVEIVGGIARNWRLCCSHALATWGGRLWQYALGLVLYGLDRSGVGSLRLIAMNGFFCALVVFFFSALVGSAIDRLPRINAGRWSMSVNNASVSLSALCLAAALQWQETLLSSWMRVTLIAFAVLLGAVSVLADIASDIVLTKDWPVVLCKGDTRLLAWMNTTLQLIDLVTKIFAPILAGHLLSSMSTMFTCLFVVVLTLLLWPLEYYLLNMIYSDSPALAFKEHGGGEKRPIDLHESNRKAPLLTDNDEPPAEVVVVSGGSFCWRLGEFMGSTLLGWVTSWLSYWHQPVFGAAISLALLYMTVLSFDGITTGFAYSQGLKEDVLAYVRGVGACIGLLGTLFFPLLRGRFGLLLTGLLGLAVEVLCLLLPVSSIWLPGSPFDPVGYFFTNPPPSSVPLATITTTMVSLSTEEIASINSSAPLTIATVVHRSYCSIWTFLLGIIMARCGLWIADLSITQLMQESLPEMERGAMFGVQSSVCQLMLLTKSLLVIVLPDPRTFGLLTIASWSSIFAALISYLFYVRRRLRSRPVSSPIEGALMPEVGQNDDHL